MATRWYKLKENILHKRYSLYSLGMGIIFFTALYIVSTLWQIPLCPVRRFFGVRCPGCGLSRGFIAILNGQLLTATKLHVLSVPLFLAIGLYGSLVLYDVITGKSCIAAVNRFLMKKPMLAVYILILTVSYCINLFLAI